MTAPKQLDSHGRLAYQWLTQDQRELLHRWCAIHDIDHTRVPIDPRIEHDQHTNEWIIDIHDHDSQGQILVHDSEVAIVTIRRTWRHDLPWPVAQ